MDPDLLGRPRVEMLELIRPVITKLLLTLRNKRLHTKRLRRALLRAPVDRAAPSARHGLLVRRVDVVEGGRRLMQLTLVKERPPLGEAYLAHESGALGAAPVPGGGVEVVVAVVGHSRSRDHGRMVAVR